MADAARSLSCLGCGAMMPVDARFCPQCGTRLTADEARETLELPTNPVRPDDRLAAALPSDLPHSVHQVHRRPLGIHPVPLLGGLGGLVLLVAIILLAEGPLIAGLILLGVALALLTLFFHAVRKEPDAPAARPTRRAADRLHSLGGLAAVTGRTWSRAGVDLLRIRRRQWRLRSELQDRLEPLGEAVHRDDKPRVQALKQQAADLEQKLSETEHEASAVIRTARRTIEHEHRTIEPTQALDPAQAEEPHASIQRPGPASNTQALHEDDVISTSSSAVTTDSDQKA